MLRLKRKKKKGGSVRVEMAQWAPNSCVVAPHPSHHFNRYFVCENGRVQAAFHRALAWNGRSQYTWSTLDIGLIYCCAELVNRQCARCQFNSLMSVSLTHSLSPSTHARTFILATLTFAVGWAPPYFHLQSVSIIFDMVLCIDCNFKK